MKFFFDFQNELKGHSGICYLGEKQNKIEILLIHENKHELIEKFKNIEFHKNEDKKKL